MTKTANKPARVAAIVSPAKPYQFKGKGAMIRNAALEGVATFAFAEGQARADIVSRLKVVLGSKPSADDVAAIRLEYVIGRTAQRIAGDAAHKGKTVADIIAYARKVVTEYAAPVQDGKKANKLRKGQTGRRTVGEHMAVRAADSAWSLIKAEVAPEQSNAKTLADKNAKAAKRSTNNNPVRGADKADAGKAGTGITHSELVKSDGPMTRKAASDYYVGMAATLLAFNNKHAKVSSTGFGQAIRAFKAAIDKEAALVASISE